MNIRIVSRRPTQPPPSPSGARINGILSSAADVQVFLQDAEGKETLLTNVKGVEWSARGGDPTTCKIELYDVELDVEAEVFPEDPDVQAGGLGLTVEEVIRKYGGCIEAQADKAAREYQEACAKLDAGRHNEARAAHAKAVAAASAEVHADPNMQGLLAKLAASEKRDAGSGQVAEVNTFFTPGGVEPEKWKGR